MDIESKLCHFPDDKGRLTTFPAKRKMKLYALVFLSSKFVPDTQYTEKAVNDLINRYTAFQDPATLRRELCDYRFLGRQRDGSAYWLEAVQPSLSELGIAD